MKRKPANPDSPYAGWTDAADVPPGAIDAATPAAAWPDAPPASTAEQSTTVTGWTGPPSAPAEPGYAESFDVSRPLGEKNPEAVIASALLDEPQSEGLRYLLNYATKSIRKNRGVSEPDRDDLLHDIYMEWWVCVGFEVTALPKLLDAESEERRSLRESIYRVFGRYRYHQSAHRTEDLAEDQCPDPTTIDRSDFTLDLDNWLKHLPDLEAKIIDLYYFQHKTMEEIGAEIGLAKQRVSEIHKRALSRHPDGAVL